MRKDEGGARRLYIDIDLPCPTIMAGGVGSVNCSQYELVDMRVFRDKRNGFGQELDVTNAPCCTIISGTVGNIWIEDDGESRGGKPDLTDKPPYAVPTMAEIRALPWNGYKVASTFSGCGGSCTGYRMAGFRVVWANEFVPAAQDSYRANMEPDCILDGRDVRTVTATEILQATGLAIGELDLFDGSPPCQAFSTAGKREKGWGKLKTYEHGAKQMNEELFFEYIRLLRGLQPKVFIAENVNGLVKGTAKGFFLEILAGLKACGYNVKAKLLDAQWLGVPQMRQRVIFVGVRNDLGLAPVYPKPLSYRYSVRDACQEIMAVSSNYFVETPTEKRKFTIAELKRICAFPDDFILTGTYAQQWERLGNSVPPVMMYHIAMAVREQILDRIWVDMTGQAPVLVERDGTPN